MREYKDSATYAGKEIKMHLRESLNQEGKFSSKHMKFDGKMSVGEQSYYFTYQCNPAYTEPKMNDVLDCLLLDASSYENSRDIDDFYNEYGYNKVSEALRAYDACKGASEALKKMFTEEELEQLNELSSNGWEVEDERDDR